MVAESISIVYGGMTSASAVLPAVIGALVVLLIGWIVGRLLGKGVGILIDRISSVPVIGESDLGKSVTKTGITPGYLGDIAVRCIVYLIAIFAAVDILNMDFLSAFMANVLMFIPNVVAFAVILVVGIILINSFIDMFGTYSQNAKIELVSPVLVLLRLFLYFVVVMLALSQLMVDLTIIYTIITPLAWGLGLGLGASIAIIVWFGMKNRSEEIMNTIMQKLSGN
ncbi:MAG: hypothetical protein GX651_01905 [Methanomicrobiales archaeon]|nr:hypothetical protein [Methanomicrobiales archaeon]